MDFGHPRESSGSHGKESPDQEKLRWIKVLIALKAVEDFLKKKLTELTMQPLAEVLARASASEREEILLGVRALRRVADGFTKAN